MEGDGKEQLVLVTGAAGYIASVLVKSLLERNYRVRGSVRNPRDVKKVGHLIKLGDEHKGKLELVEADLTNDAGWNEAVRGCSGVFHTASPVSAEEPKDPDTLIKPAVEGTLRVLRAVAAVNEQKGPDAPFIKRVVLTSSVATVPHEGRLIKDDEWDNDPNPTAYRKSKRLAERAAWDFIDALPPNQKFELATILPSFVFGPAAGPNVSPSTLIIQRLLQRVDPGGGQLPIPMVDVRDVAMAHILAFEKPEAAGKRFILSAKTLWHYEVADHLAAEFNTKGYNVSTWRIPYLVFWSISWCDKAVAGVLKNYGLFINYDGSRATRELGIQYHDVKVSINDTGYSLIEQGIIPNKLPK